MSLKDQTVPSVLLPPDRNHTANGTSAAVSVFIRTARRRQTIHGFGASDCWSINPIGEQWSEDSKERLAETLFCRDRGIGLSIWRFNIGAGSSHGDTSFASHPWRAAPCFKESPEAEYDWSRQAGQQWFLRAAHRYGVERCTAFSNSPPVWLTRNGRAFSEEGTADSTNLRPGAEPEFARFLADVLTHFAAKGLPFHDISPINEPNWDWTRRGGQEGCRYSNDDIRRVVRALHSELTSRGIPAHIDACDSGDLRLLLDDDLYREYAGITDTRGYCTIGNEEKGFPGKYREIVADLFTDPDIREILGNRISAHSYWTVNSTQDLIALRQLLRKTLRRYLPGDSAEFWMTEFCVMESGRDLGMDTALRVASVLHHDLTIAEASAWCWWLAVSPHDYKDGLIYTDFDADGGPESILPSKTAWVLGQYSRFLRPGAYRVTTETAGNAENLLVSAYGTHADSVALIITNPTTEARDITIATDTIVGDWVAYGTDETHELSMLGGVSQNRCTVPARSVVTLVAPRLTSNTRNGAGAPPE